MIPHIFCPNGHELTPDAPLARAAVACPRCGVVFGGAVGGPEMAAKPEGRKSEDEDRPRQAKAKPGDDDRPRQSKAKPGDDDRPRQAKKRPGEDDATDRPRKRPKRDEDEDEDRPRRRRRREEEDEEEDEAPVTGQPLTLKQWRMSMVRLGILFHAIKLWTYMSAMLFGFVFLPLTLFDLRAAFIIGLMYGLTVNLSMTFAPIWGIVGSSLCLYVPPKAEARGLAIVSLAFDALAPVLGILQLVMWLGFVFSEGDPRIGRFMVGLSWTRFACTFIAWWVFMIYLRKVAFFMKQTLMGSECLNIIAHLMIATVIGPTLVTVAFLAVIFVGTILVLIVFGALVLWLIYFVITFPLRMFKLLFDMRAKIYEKYLKPEDPDDLSIPVGY